MATGRVPTTANSPLTAKGDLFTYDTSQARLAVGSNGDTLLADSSQTTGLRWGDNYGFTAGKNKVINGDFRINQRAFSSTTTTGTYGFDRWSMIASDGTTTYSAQTFTAGTAPVAGYEGINFARVVSTGQTAAGAYSILQQKIEDVRTFAGQTVTVSFWAKASTGTPNIAVNLLQDFGSGGSTGVYNYATNKKFAITASWARYSVIIPVASVSGKTIGTGSNLTLYFWTSAGTTFNTQTDSMGIQSVTIDFWGAQVEAGSVATAFQTATGTLAGERSLCQRYYYRQNADALSSYAVFGTGFANTTGNTNIPCQFPVTMRVKPTAIDTSAMSTFAWEVGTTFVTTPTSITLDSNYSSPDAGLVQASKAASFTVGTYYRLGANANSGAYIGWSAEL